MSFFWDGPLPVLLGISQEKKLHLPRDCHLFFLAKETNVCYSCYDITFKSEYEQHILMKTRWKKAILWTVGDIVGEGALDTQSLMKMVYMTSHLTRESGKWNVNPFPLFC